MYRVFWIHRLIGMQYQIKVTPSTGKSIESAPDVKWKNSHLGIIGHFVHFYCIMMNKQDQFWLVFMGRRLSMAWTIDKMFF